MGGVLSGARRSGRAKLTTSQVPVVRCTLKDLARPNTPYWLRLDDGDDSTTAIATDGINQLPVTMQRIPQPLGGFRRRLVCPRCQRSKICLYVVPEGLACRICLSLRFDSQNESKRQRSIRRINRLRDRLGWMPGPLAPSGEKPLTMSNRRYEAIRNALEAETLQLMGELEEWVPRLENGIQRRRRKQQILL